MAAGSCGASLVSAIGKLPWKTLGLDAIRDGSGECLWYAVSGTYKNSPNGVSGSTTTSNMMNWDTNGQFDVMDTNGTSFLTGATSDTNAVAVIFAPGAALSGQNRAPVAGTTNCGGNYTASAYLDTANGINNSTLVTPSSPANVADTSVFIAGTASSTFNDKLVYITRADIWNAIKKRSDFNNYLRAMTRLAAECIAMYGNKNGNGSDERLPWASNVSLSGTSVPTYAVNARYDDASSAMAGRLSFKVDTSASASRATCCLLHFRLRHQQRLHFYQQLLLLLHARSASLVRQLEGPVVLCRRQQLPAGSVLGAIGELLLLHLFAITAAAIMRRS